MADKRVAVTGDVEAKPGTKMFTGAASGTWTAGPVTYTSYNHLSVGGKSVIHGANCTFTFTGSTSNGAPVTGSETVTLQAGQTVLQKGLSGVLRNGDTATGDKFDNELEVKTASVLSSN